MQPYFLPYIGYFQLISALDKFILYDDVTFIKQSWINRNRILLNDKDFLFTLEVIGASSNKKINTVLVGNNRLRLLKTFISAYQKAPQFKENEHLLNLLFKSEEKNLVKYLLECVKMINRKIGIDTELILSSDIIKDNSLKGQNKVIEICKVMKSDIYINSIGGQNLYRKDDFALEGIELLFLKSHETRYIQYSNDFIPWLSIMDILMFNRSADIIKMLNSYELI